MRYLISILMSLMLAACGGGDEESRGKYLSWNGQFVSNVYTINGIACSGDGRVVAVGSGGYISISGRNSGWNTTLATDNRTNLNAVTYCDGKFVAVGDNHTVMILRDNTTNWTRANMDNNTEIDYLSVTCGGSTIVVGGRPTDNISDSLFYHRIATSTNGTAWTTYDMSGIFPRQNANGVNRLYHGGGNFYLGTDDGRVAYSSSGTSSWTQPVSWPRNGDIITGLAYGEVEGRKISIATSYRDNASGGVFFNSDNMSHWQSSSPDNGSWPAIKGAAYANGVFAVIADNTSYTADNISEDNTTLNWQKDAFPGDNITTFTYCGGNFWAASANGLVYRSAY